MQPNKYPVQHSHPHLVTAGEHNTAAWPRLIQFMKFCDIQATSFSQLENLSKERNKKLEIMTLVSNIMSIYLTNLKSNIDMKSKLGPQYHRYLCTCQSSLIFEPEGPMGFTKIEFNLLKDCVVAGIITVSN